MRTFEGIYLFLVALVVVAVVGLPFWLWQQWGFWGPFIVVTSLSFLTFIGVAIGLGLLVANKELSKK